MKTITKTLGALALATFTIGSAFAGPSNPADTFAGPAGTRAAEGCPMIKPLTKLADSANPKSNGPAFQTVGYRHENCTGASVATMTCKPSGVACAAMRQG